MVRRIDLDGLSLALEVDKIEFNLRDSGLRPCSAAQKFCESTQRDSEKWQPLMSFHDGSTLYLHCAPDGDPEIVGYKVVGPTPRRWNITLLTGTQRVARLNWEAC
jgi:hypothetical protein